MTMEDEVSHERPPMLGGGALSGSKDGMRRFYDGINDQLDATARRRHSIFLNFGYVPGEGIDRSVIDTSGYLFNQHSVRLVAETIGDCPLEGREVLDVGSGRGGTAFLIDQHFAPRLVIGVDLSFNAVRFCRTRFPSSRLRFLQGDAERLPVRAGAFDAVTNVESSHGYPNRDVFYGEVARVLCPGGAFLYTDVFDMAGFETTLRWLDDVGLDVELDRDITPNVLRSRDDEALRHVQSFGDARAGAIAEFVGLPGSQVYGYLRGGQATYRILRLRRRA